MLELLLTTLWMLITGRRLHEPPSLHHLEAEQLVDFWADPRLDASDQTKTE